MNNTAGFALYFEDQKNKGIEDEDIVREQWATGGCLMRKKFNDKSKRIALKEFTIEKLTKQQEKEKEKKYDNMIQEIGLKDITKPVLRNVTIKKKGGGIVTVPEYNDRIFEEKEVISRLDVEKIPFLKIISDNYEFFSGLKIKKGGEGKGLYDEHIKILTETPNLFACVLSYKTQIYDSHEKSLEANKFLDTVLLSKQKIEKPSDLILSEKDERMAIYTMLNNLVLLCKNEKKTVKEFWLENWEEYKDTYRKIKKAQKHATTFSFYKLLDSLLELGPEKSQKFLESKMDLLTSEITRKANDLVSKTTGFFVMTNDDLVSLKAKEIAEAKDIPVITDSMTHSKKWSHLNRHFSKLYLYNQLRKSDLKSVFTEFNIPYDDSLNTKTQLNVLISQIYYDNYESDNKTAKIITLSSSLGKPKEFFKQFNLYSLLIMTWLNASSSTVKEEAKLLKSKDEAYYIGDIISSIYEKAQRRERKEKKLEKKTKDRFNRFMAENAMKKMLLEDKENISDAFENFNLHFDPNLTDETNVQIILGRVYHQNRSVSQFEETKELVYELSEKMQKQPELFDGISLYGLLHIKKEIFPEQEAELKIKIKNLSSTYSYSFPKRGEFLKLPEIVKEEIKKQEPLPPVEENKDEVVVVEKEPDLEEVEILSAWKNITDTFSRSCSDCKKGESENDKLVSTIENNMSIDKCLDCMEKN